MYMLLPKLDASQIIIDYDRQLRVNTRMNIASLMRDKHPDEHSSPNKKQEALLVHVSRAYVVLETTKYLFSCCTVNLCKPG